MISAIRRNPLICLLVSLYNLAFGQLTYSKKYVGTTIGMDDGEEYEIFRHIRTTQPHPEVKPSVLLVNFKFARLSQRVNQAISQLPMLMIAGFPGFRAKLYAVNKENGYWLGVYQWESHDVLEAYKGSLVLKLMNMRAIKNSVTYRAFDHLSLDDYLSARPART